MIIVDDCLVSEDLVEQMFACDIAACQGACCIEGDAGAPLEADEAETIGKYIHEIRPEMDESGIKSLEEQGISELDIFDDPVTTCKPNGECTFAIRKDGNLACSIELANQKHDMDFRKPISCHLYPIRVKKYVEYYALNYHKWGICNPACIKGKSENIRVYEFAKDALIRKFGNSWYELLENRVKEYLETQA